MHGLFEKAGRKRCQKWIRDNCEAIGAIAHLQTHTAPHEGVFPCRRSSASLCLDGVQTCCEVKLDVASGVNVPLTEFGALKVERLSKVPIRVLLCTLASDMVSCITKTAFWRMAAQSSARTFSTFVVLFATLLR